MTKHRFILATLSAILLSVPTAVQAVQGTPQITDDPKIVAAAKASKLGTDWIDTTGSGDSWTMQGSSIIYNTFPASYVSKDSAGNFTYDYPVDPIARSSSSYRIIPGMRSRNTYKNLSQVFNDLTTPVESGVKISILPVELFNLVSEQIGDPTPFNNNYSLVDYKTSWLGSIYQQHLLISYAPCCGPTYYYDLNSNIVINKNSITGFDVKLFSIADPSNYAPIKQQGPTISLTKELSADKNSIAKLWNSVQASWLARTTDAKNRPLAQAIAASFLSSMTLARTNGLTISFVQNKVNGLVSYNPKTNVETQLDISATQTTPTYFEADQGEIALGSIWMYMFDLGTNYTNSDLTYNAKTLTYTLKGEDQGNMVIVLDSKKNVNKITWVGSPNVTWTISYSPETKKTGAMSSLDFTSIQVFSDIIAQVNDQNAGGNQTDVNRYVYHNNGQGIDLTLDGNCSGWLPLRGISLTKATALLKLAGVKYDSSTVCAGQF